MQLLDVNPDHCKHYFGVVPGQRLTHPQPATVIGLSPMGARVALATRCDGPHGAGYYDVNTTLTFSGEVVQVQEEVGVIDPTALLPYPTHPTGEWVVPLPPQAIANYQFTFPYMTNCRIAWFDTTYAEREYGITHGQRFTFTGIPLTFLGIGVTKEKRTSLVECFFVLDGSPHAHTVEVGLTLDAYSDIVRMQPAHCRPVLLKPRDLLPDLPLKCNFPYWLGGEHRDMLLALDNTPAHCMAYYGVCPGQRVNGTMTIVGLIEHKGRALLTLHKDGDAGGCLLMHDNEPMFLLVAEGANAEVVPALVSGFVQMAYRVQPCKAGIPFDATFCFPIKISDRVAVKTLLDVDPQHCMTYFGVTPGQRVDGSGTAVGLWRREQENSLRMIFIDDDELAGMDFFENCKVFVTEERHPVVSVPVQPNAVFYSIRPEGVDDPVAPNFKYAVMDKTLTVFRVELVDADPDRCMRYYGVRPGDRLHPASTVIGLQKTNLGVEIIVHYDTDAAGSFATPGSFLEPTGERVVVDEHYARMLHSPPQGTFRTVTIRKLPSDEAAYSLTFPYLASMGNVMMFDIGPNLPKLIGISHGQRCRRVGKLFFFVFIGIALDPTDGSFEAFFELEGDNSIGGFPAGQTVEVFDEVVPVRPASVRFVAWQAAAVKQSCPLHCTVPFPIGEKKIRMSRIDVDPARCKEYFGIVPGQRVEGKGTFVGMAGEGKIVHPLLRKDGIRGAFVLENGVRVGIEDGVVVPIHSEVSSLQRRRAAHMEPGKDIPAYHGSDLADPSTLQRGNATAVSTGPSEANQRALEYVRIRLASSGGSSEQRILTLKEAGYTAPQETLQLMQQFVCHQVPLVTWFKPFKMLGPMPQIEAMTNDICLRNLFEVGHGNGSQDFAARHGWEARMFGDVYGEDSAVCERPKYGAANILNDPKGPRVCDWFGDCYLVFSPELRPYTTMTGMDSATSECSVCTLENGVSVWSQFDDDGEEAFVALADVAVGVRPFVSSTTTYSKEVHIHSPVLLDQHITHLVVPDQYFRSLGDAHMLLNFCLKNGCWLVSDNTVAFLASLRLLPSAELQAMAQRLGVDSLRPRERESCLLCGPPRMEDRRVYDAICDYYCMLDTRMITQWVMSCNLENVWSPPPT